MSEEKKGATSKINVSDPTQLGRSESVRRLIAVGIAYDSKDSTNRLTKKLVKYWETEENETGKVESTASSSGTIQVCKGTTTAIESKIKLEFEMGKDNLETFIERLELLFKVNKVTEEANKIALLLTKISGDAYKLAKNLCHPTKLQEAKYADIVKALSNHLCPKPSEIMKRYNFYSAKQTATENVADYVTRLKNLSLNCNFTTADTAIRDQLVCGIREHAT